MRTRPSAWLAVALLLSPAAGHCRDLSTESIGTDSAEFLSIDVGARGVGMAGAYTAVTNDAYSLYWNPAGLAQIPMASVSAMSIRYPGDIRFDYGAYAQRLNDTAVIGAAFRHMDVGSIPSTDINGNGAGYVHPHSYVWEFGWGQYVPDLSDSEKDVTLGAVARYAHSDLQRHADIFAGDVGLQTHHVASFIPWRFGIALQNFGKGPKYDEKRERLPARLRAGAAIEPTKFWVVSLDGTAALSNEPNFALGSEFTLDAGENAKAFLRGGIETTTLMHGLDGFRGANFGVGIKTLQFTFDYAFSALGQLGHVHRFAVSFNLPQKMKRRYRDQ